jgi:glutathione S-transferase
VKLFYSPGSCALGIHVLLEEIGKPYELHKVNLATREQYAPDYVAINPKSKVPALQRDDGSVLTEWPAIAAWLAMTNSDKGLLSTDPETFARTLESVDYVAASLHMQGFTRMFRPANFAPTEADHEAVKARGEEIFQKGLGVMDKALEGREWLAGTYSFADTALFYVSFWWAARLNKPLPANVAAHYARMNARPAVQRTLKTEGLS